MRANFHPRHVLPVIISLLLALDPSGDWGLSSLSSGNLLSLQPIILGFLLVFILFLFPSLLRGLTFTPLTLSLVVFLAFSCLLSIYSGSSPFALSLDLFPIIAFPLISLCTLSGIPLLTPSVAMVSLRVLIYTSAAKAIFIMILLGPAALQIANPTKFTPILGILGLSCYLYNVVNRFKLYHPSPLDPSLFIVCISFLFFSQQRSLLFLATLLVISDLVIQVFRFRVLKLYVVIISLFASLLLCLSFFHVKPLQVRLDLSSPVSHDSSFTKRIAILQCFSNTSFFTFALGSGLGSPILCSEESSAGLLDAYLRQNQSELEIPALFLRLGLFLSICLLFFCLGLMSRLTLTAPSSLFSILFFLLGLYYSFFQSLFLSAYYQWVLFLLLGSTPIAYRLRSSS